MTEKTQGIVLSVRKHNDKNNIITLFTPKYGRVTFLSPVSSSARGKMRQARIQLLSVVEFEFRYNPAKDLHRLGSISLSKVWTNIYSSPVKCLIVIFLSEFLDKIIRASMPENEMWDYIVSSLEKLENENDNFSDFHIVFLCHMLSFSGILPDSTTFSEGYFFDMRDGKFSYHHPPHNDVISDREARIVYLISRLNYDNISHLKMKAKDRRNFLDLLLRYFNIHYPGTGNLTSLATLKEFFS